MRWSVPLLWLAVCSCGPTRDANFLPIDLGRAPYPPWDAPVYGADELAAMFPGDDYSTLQSVFVEVDGDDATADGTRERPYGRIQSAIEAHEAPGVIIRVGAGIYREPVRVSVIATQDAPFVLYSEDGMGAAVIDGGGGSAHIVGLSGRYNVIDGFEVKDTLDYAIAINPTHVGFEQPEDAFAVVRNCHVHHAGRDVVKMGNGNFFLIENNDIHSPTHERQADNAIDGVAVYHSLCRGNFIHDTGVGIGGYFKGGSSNNLWVGNTFADIGDPESNWEGGGYGLQLGGRGMFSWRDQRWYEYPAGYHQLAYNNLFINCAMGGVLLTSVQESQVYNNTFINTGYRAGDRSGLRALIRVFDSNHNGTAGIDIANNVFFNDAEHPVDAFFVDVDQNNDTGAIRTHHNTVFSAGREVRFSQPGGPDETDLQQDPRLVSPAESDGRLAPDSPAIDTGADLDGVPDDRDGVPRPRGEGTDRGAYEQ